MMEVMEFDHLYLQLPEYKQKKHYGLALWKNI